MKHACTFIFLICGITGLIQSVIYEAWQLTFLSACSIILAILFMVEKNEEKVKVNNLSKTKKIRL